MTSVNLLAASGGLFLAVFVFTPSDALPVPWLNIYPLLSQPLFAVAPHRGRGRLAARQVETGDVLDSSSGANSAPAPPSFCGFTCRGRGERGEETFRRALLSSTITSLLFTTM
jgi:hypothetical protein